MSLETAFICEAATAIHQAILAHEADIEGLDRAIGDGDHYINMKRGSEVIADMHHELLPLPVDEALNKIGMKLLSTIGGASGPLFASFFMGMAKVVKYNGASNPLEIAAAFAAGVQAIIQRGKAGLGEKTMLDVLIPVSTTFTTSATADKNVAKICHAVTAAADEGLESTRNLIATKGRAAGLGERAIGHLDAGAKSCQVMTHAVCNLLL
jgi:phosphoenolpyruvate---glycerone phosphotransferase subunit DhaL